MSSHNKNNQKRVSDIPDNGSDDGQKTDQTITYSRNKPKISPKSLTKGHKILITIAVIVVVASIVAGVCIYIKKKQDSGQNSGIGEGSGQNPGTGEGSGQNPETGEGSGQNPGTGEGSGQNPGTGEGSGQNPGTGEGSGQNPGTGGESGSGENSGTGEGPNSGENPGQINEDNPLTKEDIKEIIKPIFKVDSKERTLNQVLMEYKEKITIKDNSLSSNTLIKAIFDIYILSESQETDSDFYSRKFTTSIAINNLLFIIILICIKN